MLIALLILGGTQYTNVYSQANVGRTTDPYVLDCQILDSLDDYTVDPANMEFSKYGGWKAHQTTATGFFHVEKIDGRWWAIDPEGYYFVHKAPNSVHMFTHTEEEIYELLGRCGFNGLGNWSDDEIHETSLQDATPLAYCPGLSFIGVYRKEREDNRERIEFPIFDDGFEAFANEYAKGFAKYVNDPNVYGYFSDNELGFKSQGLDIHLALTDQTDPNYLAAVAFLDSIGKTSTNWDEDDKFAYMALMGERYYSIVSAAIKAVDPNHMYIGSRCNSTEKTVEAFMTNAGKYVDVFSTNHYSKWGARDVEITNMEKWSGRPLMLTEFYAMFDETADQSGSGAGWRVLDQESRGMFYQNFVSTTAETGCVVGWHWFKFQDDKIDVCKGLIAIQGDEYPELLKSMKQMNEQIYNFIDYVDSKPEAVDTLAPSKDAYYKGNTNYGSDIELISKYSGNDSYIRETHIQFDLSSVPSGKYTAKLNLFSISPGSEVSNYQAELVEDDNWEETTIKYSNRPASSKVLRTWSHGGDVTIDLTDEVVAAIADNGKLSIRLTATYGSKAATFGSSEHPNTVAQPKLMLYTDNGTPVGQVLAREKAVVFPNPVDNVLSITNGMGSEMRIFSLAGRLVQQGNILNNTQDFDVSTLANGVYVVQLTNNGSVETRKILKR